MHAANKIRIIFLLLLLVIPVYGLSSELDESGGPDEYGYYYIDSEEIGGPQYNWVDIRPTGGDSIPADLWADESYVGPIWLTFMFPFYDEEYGSVLLSSEGYLTFLNYEDPPVSQNVAIPDTSPPNAIIAWFWDNLNPVFNGVEPSVWYGETGDSAFVIQFQSFCTGDDEDNLIQAEILLYENGDIVLQYESIPDGINLTGKTIGIEDETGTAGFTVSYNNEPANYPLEELAIRFYQIPDNAILSGIITDQETGEPIEYVTITCGEMQDESDEDGHYEVGPLWSNYPLQVIAQWYGYFTHIDTVTLNPEVNTYNFSLLPWPESYQSWSTDFESNPDMFTNLHATQDWEWGDPDGGAAHSGELCWGNSLSGEYANGIADTLISMREWYIAGEDASFSYWHFYDFENNVDGYHLLISSDSLESWQLLTPNDGYSSQNVSSLANQPGFSGNLGGEWEEVVVNLNDWADEEVFLAFVMGTDGENTATGVLIDDFSISLPTGSIEGAVVINSNEPVVENIPVFLYEPVDHSPVLYDTTDVDGEFAFHGLLPESFFIHIDHSGIFQDWNDTVVVALNDTLQVEAEIDSIPLYSCTEVQQEHNVGDLVRVKGIVTLGDNIISDEYSQFYLQDMSGMGLELYSDEAPDPAAPLYQGIEIHAWGELQEDDENTVLVDYELEMLSTGNTLPAAQELTSLEASTFDSLEGCRVMVSGRLMDTPEPGGSYSIRLDDGSAQLQVHLYENANVVLVDYPRFSWLTIEGVLTHNVLDNLWLVPGCHGDITPYVYPPRNFTADLDTATGIVHLDWEHTPQPGQLYELIYDDDAYTGSYHVEDYVMSTRFSPELPCQITKLKFFTLATDDDATSFEAEIYPWIRQAPDTEPSWTSTLEANNMAWTEIDLSDQSVEFNGDFTVGFAAGEDPVSLAFDAGLDNGRSFDYDGTEWIRWHQAYLIRIEVIYEDGTLATLSPVAGEDVKVSSEPREYLALDGSIGMTRPVKTVAEAIDGNHELLSNPSGELDEFSNFMVIRDGHVIAEPLSSAYHDTLPEFGEYLYSLRSVYDEANSTVTGPIQVDWYDTRSDEPDTRELPESYALEAVWPNPFNSSLTVRLALPDADAVTIHLYDILGREALQQNLGTLHAGHPQFSFTADHLPSGVYFLKVQSQHGINATRKVVLLK